MTNNTQHLIKVTFKH